MLQGMTTLNENCGEQLVSVMKMCVLALVTAANGGWVKRGIAEHERNGTA